MLSDPISVYLLGDARTRLGVVVMVPCMLLTGVENLHKHCFYGIGRVRPPAAVETAEQLIRAVAVLGLLIALLPRSAEETVGLIALGMVLCEVFSACALTLLFRRHWRRFPPGPAGEDVSGRRLLAIALPVGATSLLGTLLGSANSVLIPAKLVEGGMGRSEAISELGVVCGMTLPMLSLPIVFLGALNLVLVPRLSRACALGRPAEARRLISQAVSAVSLSRAPAVAAGHPACSVMLCLLQDSPCSNVRLAGRALSRRRRATANIRVCIHCVLCCRVSPILISRCR